MAISEDTVATAAATLVNAHMQMVLHNRAGQVDRAKVKAEVLTLFAEYRDAIQFGVSSHDDAPPA